MVVLLGDVCLFCLFVVDGLIVWLIWVLSGRYVGFVVVWLNFCLLMVYCFIVWRYLVLIVLGSSLFYVAEFVAGYLVDCVSFIVSVWGDLFCFDFGLVEVLCCLAWFVVLMLVACYIALRGCC